MNKVLVVGSLNMDFAVYMDRRPLAGETVMARGMKLVPGGKGANQAYALGKLGVRTSMIGAVGTDSSGEQLLESLESVSVNTTGIQKMAEVETGKAFIEIESSGQNSISVIAGANAAVDEAVVQGQENLFAKADAVVMQLEIPVSSVVAARLWCLTLLRQGLTCLMNSGHWWTSPSQMRQNWPCSRGCQLVPGMKL